MVLKSQESRHRLGCGDTQRVELLPLDHSFQDHHAGRRFGLSAVFSRDENLKVFVRGSGFQAAFQIVIDSERAQELRIFAARLYPDQISLLARRERLRSCHVFYLDLNAGVAVAIVVRNDFAFGCGSSSGVGKPVLPAPDGSGQQKAEQQKQSDGAMAHRSPHKTKLK